MKFYHVTTKASARSIRRNGFRNRRKMLGVDDAGKSLYVCGVWLSNKPWVGGGNCEIDELPKHLDVIIIDIHAREVTRFEVVNDCAPYREWCIPAAIVNQHLKRVEK